MAIHPLISWRVVTLKVVSRARWLFYVLFAEIFHRRISTEAARAPTWAARRPANRPEDPSRKRNSVAAAHLGAVLGLPLARSPSRYSCRLGEVSAGWPGRGGRRLPGRR